MEERSTRFSLLVTGIFVLLLLVLGFLLRPKDTEEPSKPLAADSLQPAAKPDASSHLLPPPIPPTPPAGTAVPISNPGQPGGVPRAVVRNQQILTHCHLVQDPANDADSFRVRTTNGEYRFCLYFVDAPDANGSSPDTISSQCRYFGGLTEQELRGVARDAQLYVLNLLHDREFDVVTRWEPAPEEGTDQIQTCRGFVFLPGGSASPVNLAELLVENGLVTLSHCSEPLPDLTSPQAFQRKLQSIEQIAISRHSGGWRFQERVQTTSMH